MDRGGSKEARMEELNAVADKFDALKVDNSEEYNIAEMLCNDSASGSNLDSKSITFPENIATSEMESEVSQESADASDDRIMTLPNLYLTSLSGDTTCTKGNESLGVRIDTNVKQQNSMSKRCEYVSDNLQGNQVEIVGALAAAISSNSEESLRTSDSSNDLASNASSEECSFHQLPDEIMHLIFQYLTLGELCTIAAQVCRRWCDLVCDPIHWKKLTIGHLPTSTAMYCLGRAPLLKYLSMERRNVLTTEETLRFSRDCPLLRELNLAFIENLSNDHIKIIAASCNNLLQLNMEGCGLVDDESLGLVSRMKKLTSLNVSHCWLVQTEGVENLAINLPCIKELNIDGIPNVEDSAIFTLVLQHGDNLEHLYLDGVELTDAAIQAISKCENITHLHISFAELLTDTALLYVKKMKGLRSLRLKKGAYFSREGLVDMFKAGFLSNIESLNLSECVQLYDDGVQALVKCKTLQHLDLQWCWFITDVGLEAIVKNCHEMKTLDLVGLDKIRGQCLEIIPRTMKKLEELDLQQCNQIIDDLVVDLVRELPHLVAYNYYGERFQYNKEGILVIQ